MLCIVFLGIGITGIKKSITDNYDSQKWVIFLFKKNNQFFTKKNHTKKTPIINS
jgi:hypothetical protein